MPVGLTVGRCRTRRPSGRGAATRQGSKQSITAGAYHRRMRSTATGAVAPPRRQQILDAAADLFAQHGFRGVSIYQIGGAVGISGPALYRHFSSKDAVLAEMLIGISEHLLQRGRELAAGSEAGQGTLQGLIEMQVEFALDHPALITVHFRDIDSLAPQERRKVRRLQRQYVEIWAEAIRAMAPGTGESAARSAAHAVFGLINSTPHISQLSRAETGALLRRMAFGAVLGALGRSR